MVPREKKKHSYAKFGGKNKEYYGIFRSGVLVMMQTDDSLDTALLNFVTTARLINFAHCAEMKICHLCGTSM